MSETLTIVESKTVTLADGRERRRTKWSNGDVSYWWHSRHRMREITSPQQRAQIDAAIARSA
ncbi:hypothetical protein [Burkholderia cepacia]|uniref:hypothetical protein n=1 Tax=Burkholderia cepacia TaxID=292 RepID=UPI0009C10890|nr:hypothetical protein [Burkholderia cepacia]